MEQAEFKELQTSISLLIKKVDRLSMLMLPQEVEPETDLDRIEQQIEEFGLNPEQALIDAGVLKPKRRRGSC